MTLPDDQKDQLTVFHITAWKAGSTWVQGVLNDLAPDRVLIPPPSIANGIDFVEPIPGRIYTPLYMHRPRFNESPFADFPHRKFVVIRDLRDTLISLYFSLARTHDENPSVLTHRAELQKLSQEDGFSYLVNHPDFSGLSMILGTWFDAPDALVIRFEDIIEQPHHWFRRIVDECGISVDDQTLANILELRSFKNLAGGRPRGVEGVSHYRRGVANDWKRYFTPRISREFARKFDDLIVRTGYTPTFEESDLI